jgi:hypothetical protein
MIPRTSNGASESAEGSVRTSRRTIPDVFRGRRGWRNSDDRFDLINASSSATIESPWPRRNGYLPGTTSSAGNGNGFKTGGDGVGYQANAARHTVRLSVAFANQASSFYADHHPPANDFVNNASDGTVRNIPFTSTPLSNEAGTSDPFNSRNLGVSLSNAQFQTVSTAGWDAPRQADGSLPGLPDPRLAPASNVIDKGLDVGLPSNGSAPYLGALQS